MGKCGEARARLTSFRTREAFTLCYMLQCRFQMSNRRLSQLGVSEKRLEYLLMHLCSYHN